MTVTMADNPDPNTDVRDGAEWEIAKKKVLKRDQYRCQHCRIHEAKFPGTDLQVHHIRPVEKGGSNDLENLITLCNSCHWKVHNHSDDDAERLTPDLIDENRATFKISGSVRDGHELNDCQDQILQILKEDGPTKLEHIADQLDYSYNYVQTTIQRLKGLNYICRVSRGVYAYISKSEIHEVEARDENEYGRTEVRIWDPGKQSELDQFLEDGDLDD